jgi:hypothetical protein
MKEHKESQSKQTGKVHPQRTPKTPLQPQKVEEGAVIEEGEADRRDRGRVPRSQSERLVETSHVTVPLPTLDSPGKGDVHFTTYVPSVGPGAWLAPGGVGECPDLSGGDSETLALHTANYYIDMVDGNTVKRFDPTTVFPGMYDVGWRGGFMGDQAVVYVPSIDRFVLCLLYIDWAGGAFRLATASPAALRDNFQTAWTYWDFPSSLFGTVDHFDEPYLSGGFNLSQGPSVRVPSWPRRSRCRQHHQRPIYAGSRRPGWHVSECVRLPIV